MFDIGWPEFLLVAVLVLVVLGPKELPVVMGAIGRFIARIRNMMFAFEQQLQNPSVTDAPDEEKTPVRNAKKHKKD